MGILDGVNVEIRECGEEMMDLGGSDFVLEPMYFKWKFSDTEILKARKGIVERLGKARRMLPRGWNFKIWDAFRTVRTQTILYDDYYARLKAENPAWNEDELAKAVTIFVSFPSRDIHKPAPHNTGGALDLTLIDASGQEIPMGSEFDEFDYTSHTDYFRDKDARFHENRMLLKSAMESAGFVNYCEEWWHFSYGDQVWAKETKTDFAIYGSMEL